MRETTISVAGLLNWDPSLFDWLDLPEGIDADILIPNLLVELAELEIIYPNPAVFKVTLQMWSKKQKPIWEKLLATTELEYNPIENYNRTETGTTSGSGSVTHGGQDTESMAIMHGGQDTIQTQSADGGADSGTSGQFVAGFNPGTPSGSDDGLFKNQRDENSITYGKTNSGSRTDSYGRTESRTGTRTYGQTETSTDTGGHTVNAHGNIGVMSTQDMIAQEREIVKFNVYDYIIEDFKHRFCVLVY